jgi:hypothetical protein
MSCEATSAFEGWQLDASPGRSVLVDHLVSDLALGRIQSLAFVVPSDVSMTLPLYDVAIATARRGWKIGIEDVRYWFVTPEPEPLASFGTAVSAAVSQRLEPEGITFVGSTYPDLRDGVVLLDPQGESIEVDAVIGVTGEASTPRLLFEHGYEGARSRKRGSCSRDGFSVARSDGVGHRDHLGRSDEPVRAARAVGHRAI